MHRRDIAKSLLASTAGAVLLPQVAAAQACSAPCYPPDASESGISPLDTRYPSGDVRRYGAIGDGDPGKSTANSTAFQRAVDQAYARGGGVVYVPAGVYCTNAPIVVYENVSIAGDGKAASIVKKTTNTASTVSDATSRFWDSTPVENPICVFHFVNHDDLNTWAYAEVRDIAAYGNSTSPNTSVVTYGFFFRGMAGARVRGCMAQYVQVGFFWGSGSVITSEITANQAGYVHRSFYMHFATSTQYQQNYANFFRFAGHYFSGYYCHVANNACDNGGHSSLRGSSTEIAQAYEFHSCVGTTIECNGCETHNGPVWLMESNISTQFRSNLALAVTSDYSGSANVAAFSSVNCIDCVYEDNRAILVSLTGVPARHFNWITAAEYGQYQWARNHFYSVLNATGPDTGWHNTLGTL